MNSRYKCGFDFEMAKPEKRQECIRLRVDERLSLKEIGRRTGIGSGTLSLWLKPYPLSADEQRANTDAARRRDLALGKVWARPKKPGLPPAPGDNARTSLDAALKGKTNSLAIGFLAESAILNRLARVGLEVYVPASTGSRVDFMVHTKSGAVAKVQVKTIKRIKTGLCLKLTRGQGRHAFRYLDTEFDIIIGYDIERDVAYVFSADDVRNHLTCIMATKDSAERWDKIENFGKIAEVA